MYQICSTCVMDTSDPEIKFFGEFCNHCIGAYKSLWEIHHSPPLPLERIKKDAKKYDCLIGLSGGVDSSMALVKAVELGLKPLCFTVDNGWNTPESDENILRLVEGLNVPFYRYTIDIPKFKELQGAFIDSQTANIEIPTDHILMATTYEMASKYGIKWIISGGNVATESIMPQSWGYQARDLKHIKSIYRKFTGRKLKGLPLISLWKYNWYLHVKRIKTLYILDYFKYNRAESIEYLQERFGWKDYGKKHGESKFTKWFQEEYLFKRFGIDKDRAHYSSLICSGQMTREEALRLLKPLGTHLAPVSPYRYPTNEFWWNLWSKVFRFLRDKGIYANS